MPHQQNHLTADELDAFLIDKSSALASSHVATCPSCAAMVAADARVVAALRALPMFNPSPAFSDAIMARVRVMAVPVAAAAQVAEPTPRSAAARRRATVALGIGTAGLAAGFAWAMVHPDDALRWSAPAVDSAAHTVWLSLQHLVGGAVAQPWFSTVRDTLASPVHALIASAGMAAVYALALLGLRRLMTEPAPDASW
ncbi:MAG TPA: hypothetical protein VGM77_01695 [Gemmatimonadales bacterium]|jgi:hypothetical protein